MIETPPLPRKSRFSRFLIVAAALLMATGISASALSGDSEVKAKLPPGVTLATATMAQIRNACNAALADPISTDPKIFSAIVYSGSKRAPIYASQFSSTGLKKVYMSDMTDADKKFQAILVVRRSLYEALKYDNKGTGISADIAAQVVLSQVDTALYLPLPSTAGMPDPLSLVIRTATKQALDFGRLEANGSIGVTVAGVNRVAGVDNWILQNETRRDRNVRMVMTVVMKTIENSISKGGRGVFTIASRAAAYSFAETYLVTHNDPSTQVSVERFRKKNVPLILEALTKGLSDANKTNPDLIRHLEMAIRRGIGIAYNGGSMLGSSGVGDFNNSHPISVSSTTGL